MKDTKHDLSCFVSFVVGIGFSYMNPLRHRSNGSARLLPSVRVVQLGRSLALPFIRSFVFQ